MKLPKTSLVHIFRRSKSSLSLWHEELNTDIKKKIERHWSNEVFETKKNHSESCYILPMFPYPSGNLHMGHVRVYSISDTVARFHSLNGKNVIHPMGWDSFGLPAENAAIEHNILPHKWTAANIDQMKKQLISLGLKFDWNREITTSDPSYYKWTQYIFLKLFENNMAYQSKSIVNWDPVDKTVLADEQVDENGCSWRSGAKVEKKYLTQWFIRATQFSKKLYEGLKSDSLENWNDIINLQEHWIGECNGVVVTCEIKIKDLLHPFEIWSSEPYKFIHGQFVTVSNQNIMIQNMSDHEKNNLTVINPITNKVLPVYVSDSVEYAESRDAYIACPTNDDKDYQLAKTLNINVQFNPTIDENTENQKAIEIANAKRVGGYYVSSKLKDWLISRQRYWGTPIPIVHCSTCGTVPVPYEELPVQLPEIENLQSREHIMSEWSRCSCPRCGNPAKRETDTMDTFVDSSWYYYRFLDPHNEQMPFDKNIISKNIPVDLYIGGKEHAVLHLYYARFMSYFLHSLGWTESEEPFRKLLVQGMIKGQSYRVKSSGKYIPVDNVDVFGCEYKEKGTGEPVIVQWEKMSKSKHNGEKPERLLSEYGCDTTRLFVLSDVPPMTHRNWSDATFPGVLNWQNRLWWSMRDFLEHRKNKSLQVNAEDIEKFNAKLFDARNYFIAQATNHFKYTHKISVGISRLHGLTNLLRNKVPPEMQAKSREFELTFAHLIIMLAPAAPHFAAELWAGLQSAQNRLCDSSLLDWESGVHEQSWPRVHKTYGLPLICRVDGAQLCILNIKAVDLPNLSQEEALKMVLNDQKVAKRVKRGICKVQYILQPDCMAMIYLYTDLSVKKVQEKVKQINELK